MTGIDDFSRMGAFRFKELKDGGFINVSELLKIPPLADIRELIAASAEIEKSEEGMSCLTGNGLPNSCSPVLHWEVQDLKPV